MVLQRDTGGYANEFDISKCKNVPEKIELMLPRRSLYVLRGVLRYHYTHAIKGFPEDQESERRISIICRNEHGHSTRNDFIDLK